MALMKYTVPLYIVGVLLFFQLERFPWVVLAGMLSDCLPYLSLLYINEAEFRLIRSRHQVIEYVYARLREFGIDER